MLVSRRSEIPSSARRSEPSQGSCGGSGTRGQRKGLVQRTRRCRRRNPWVARYFRPRAGWRRRASNDRPEAPTRGPVHGAWGDADDPDGGGVSPTTRDEIFRQAAAKLRQDFTEGSVVPHNQLRGDDAANLV